MADISLENRIMEENFPDEETKHTLREIMELHGEEKSSDVILAMNSLFMKNKLKKKRVEKTIFFFRPNEEEERLKHMTEDELDEMNDDGTEDYRNISKLARKFRSCRYQVERTFEASNGITYSLKLSKKGKEYYVLFSSSEDMFKSTDIFEKMLEVDESIRIVTVDDMTKMNIARRFDAFVGEKYGENGFVAFKNEHSFEILSLRQFFKKTTWKSLVK